MNFIYICRVGENEELRYSIRSVLNSFPEANIWVIGGKPLETIYTLIKTIVNTIMPYLILMPFVLQT